jgi:hypothetical protein
MKISPDIIYLEIQPNALLLRQNFDSQKVSVTECKPNHLVSLKTATVLGCRHEQGAPKYGSSTDEQGGSQGRTRLRSETLSNDKAKPNAEMSPEKAAVG